MKVQDLLFEPSEEGTIIKDGEKSYDTVCLHTDLSIKSRGAMLKADDPSFLNQSIDAGAISMVSRDNKVIPWTYDDDSDVKAQRQG